MQLFCRMMFAGLVFTAVSIPLAGQSVVERHSNVVRPFASISVGPGNLNSAQHRRGAYPLAELAIGARRRISNRFGVVASAHAGKTFTQVLGGEDAYCRPSNPDGSGRCIEHVPMLDWYGAAIGAEAYLGRAILSMTTGPASFGTRDYERIFVSETEPTRALGLRTQFEALLPVYGRVGLSMSAAHRSVPAILATRMSVTSFGLGFTLR
jgi:hypothetical protein